MLTSTYFPDPDGEDPNTTGPEFRPWTRDYHDDQGRVLRVEDSLFRETVYQYNNRDWVTQVTLPDPDGSGSQTSPVTSTTYDAAGRVLTQTDPLARVTTNTSTSYCGRVWPLRGPRAA